MSVTVEAHMQYPVYFCICFQSFIKKKTDYRPISQGKAVPAHTNATYIPAMQKWLCCPVLKLSHTLSILLDFCTCTTLHPKNVLLIPICPPLPHHQLSILQVPPHPVQDILPLHTLCPIHALYCFCNFVIYSCIKLISACQQLEGNKYLFIPKPRCLYIIVKYC